MTYIYNSIFLFFISILTLLGRGYTIKKRVFNCYTILENNFEINFNFSFIQVGANDGIRFDKLYDFVIKRKSLGIVIEPIKKYYLKLADNYRDFPAIIKVNKAVHSIDKKVNIFKISDTKYKKYPEWVEGIASLDKNHHKKSGVNSEDIVAEEVQAETLMNIINTNYSIKSLDFFQVDTEGYDYEILKMLDLNILKPKIIKYESVNLTEEDLKSSHEYLKSKRYYLFVEKGDTIAVDLRKVKLMF